MADAGCEAPLTEGRRRALACMRWRPRARGSGVARPNDADVYASQKKPRRPTLRASSTSRNNYKDTQQVRLDRALPRSRFWKVSASESVLLAGHVLT